MERNPRQSFEVRIWSTRVTTGRRGTSYGVRWRVGSRAHFRSFATSKLAESFRAQLVVASRAGEAFDEDTGAPLSQLPTLAALSWLEHAANFVDTKWTQSSARHRKGIAEGLTTTTYAAAAHEHTEPRNPEKVRAALQGWAFNTAARGGNRLSSCAPPPGLAEALTWVERNSPTLTDFARPTILRPVLESLALRLDGGPASPSTTARKRSALYSALAYAVELGLLASNPMDRIRLARTKADYVVDRRVVVNPEQAAELLQAVRRIYPSVEAYFACLYYAGLRPAEARHLRVRNLDLPEEGWGWLVLEGSTPTSPAAWTTSGTRDEDRQLKHRSRKDTRSVPASPALVRILREHQTRFPAGLGGRLFVTRTGRAGVPLAGPYGTPQSMSIIYRVWDLARQEALTSELYDSPLAKRPYDLRHAAVSLWLNAGVPATQVAEWAGHSVNVLLRVYAKCVYGAEEAAVRRVETALGTAGQPLPVGLEGKTNPQIVHGSP